VTALIGAAAIALGCLFAASSAGATGSGEIAVVSSGARPGFLGPAAIDLIPSDRLATTGNSKLLASVNGGFYDLQWTPDGKTLVYAQQTGKASSPRESIYAVDVPSLRRRLLAANVSGGHPEVLSPDGKTVAYSAPAARGTYGVYLVGIDGNSPRHLIDGRSSAWSPDGKRLAVLIANNAFVIVGTNGKVAARVSLGRSPTTLVQSIAWGPTGKSLLVDIVDAATFADHIQLVGLDGRVQHAFTSTAAPFTGVWSPRGTQVAFAERRGAKEYVVVVGADGSGRHSIGSEEGDITLGWSPDGRSVVIANGSQVRIIQADGTGARIVANAAGSGSLDDPAWQPRP
jgi:Tol biopolymer transport system component